VHFIRLNVALPLYLYTKHSYWCYALLSNLRGMHIGAEIVPWELACVAVLRAIGLLQMVHAGPAPAASGLWWTPKFDLRAKLARSNATLSHALPKPGTAEAEAFWAAHDARTTTLAYRIIAVDPHACSFSPAALRYSHKPDSWAHSIWGCPQILESYARELDASSRQCVLLIALLADDSSLSFTHVGAVSAHPHEFELVVPPCEYSILGEASDAPIYVLWEDLLRCVSELLQTPHHDKESTEGPMEARFVADAEIERSPLFHVLRQHSPAVHSSAVIAAVKDFCTHFWFDLWPATFRLWACNHPASVWGGSVTIHVAFVFKVRPYEGLKVSRPGACHARPTVSDFKL
jgi:hypothetical protein